MKAPYWETIFSDVIRTGLTLRRGRLVEITDDGEILVESHPERVSISCDFLRTSSAPLPSLRPGTYVLYAVDEVERHGYVFGVIQRVSMRENDTTDHMACSQDLYNHAQVKINADEKIELKCGASSLTMDRDGKVVIRGETITSRSRGTNKIKGGSVQIN